MPSNVRGADDARGRSGSLHGAVAAGILGAGPVVLGTSAECARLLADAQTRVAAGASRRTSPWRFRERLRDSGGKAPGFGHPVHRPTDPRAERILELADERGVSGSHVRLARCFLGAVAEDVGKAAPDERLHAIAAVLLDLGYPPVAVKAIPILARTASLLAHLARSRGAVRLPHGRSGRGSRGVRRPPPG